LSGSGAILLTDTAAQLCAALFDRRDYPPRAALFDRRSHPEATDDFEGRVQRLWQHVKTAYFSVEEHGRLRASIRELIDSELTPGE
jgi:hypothetical protein